MLVLFALDVVKDLALVEKEIYYKNKLHFGHMDYLKSFTLNNVEWTVIGLWGGSHIGKTYLVTSDRKSY